MTYRCHARNVARTLGSQIPSQHRSAVNGETSAASRYPTGSFAHGWLAVRNEELAAVLGGKEQALERLRLLEDAIFAANSGTNSIAVVSCEYAVEIAISKDGRTLYVSSKLEGCEAISDNAMTYVQSTYLIFPHIAVRTPILPRQDLNHRSRLAGYELISIG